MATLQGKAALVTGASRNIGKAIAIRLAQAGCRLLLAAHSDTRGLKDAAAEARKHDVDVHTALSDLSTDHGCDQLLKCADDHLGGVDVLVHTVALRPHRSFETLALSEWESVRSIILDSAMNLTMGVVPGMVGRSYGRIVLFTGLGAHAGAAQRAHVSAAKMGLVGLARGLASEFASRNIRVNVISPGTIDTHRANPQWYTNAPLSTQTIPMERMGTVREIADTTHFLVSEASGFVTGQTIHVNGGESFFS